MKTPLLIVLIAVALVATLAIMNNACKSSHHEWCAPVSNIRHHIQIGHS